MYTKITKEQASLLNVGDTIRRYPHTTKDTRDNFDENAKDEIETFVVQSVNRNNHMLGLMVAGESMIIFASPGEITRLFIKSENLFDESRWWV